MLGCLVLIFRYASAFEEFFMSYSDLGRREPSENEVELSDSSEYMHQMCVQRMRLLHIANGLQEYIMTNVSEFTDNKVVRVWLLMYVVDMCCRLLFLC